jgi:hypothetical protein
VSPETVKALLIRAGAAQTAYARGADASANPSITSSQEQGLSREDSQETTSVVDGAQGLENVTSTSYNEENAGDTTASQIDDEDVIPPVAATAKLSARVTRATADAIANQSVSVRPWMVKDTTNYTSTRVDRLLAKDAPVDQPELVSRTSLTLETDYRADVKDKGYKIFNAPLLGGTTFEERDLIDQEFRQDSKNYKFKHLGPAQILPKSYEILPDDIELEFRKGIWVAPKETANDTFDLDPPGSGLPADALKFPNRLIACVNLSARSFPPGWDENAINAIPDRYFTYIRPDLLAKLPYEQLKNRPSKTWQQLAETAPFWDAWEADEGRKIIINFVAKIRGGHSVLATSQSPAGLVKGRALGQARLAPSSDWPIEACKNCAKSGVKCDGVKPACGPCKEEGVECQSFESLIHGDIVINGQESYMRTGSPYDQAHGPGPFAAADSEVAATPDPMTGPILSKLDILAYAAETVKTGSSRSQRPAAGIPGINLQPAPSPHFYKERIAHGRIIGELAMNAGTLVHSDIDIEYSERKKRAYFFIYPQEDAFYTRPSIRITVPDHLKNLLVDDWENVTKSLLLVPLPSQAPANYIIDVYFNEEKMHRRLGSPEADVLEEFCAGLKMYFEKAVAKILLYRFERAQLTEVCPRALTCPSLCLFADFCSV